VRFALLAYTSPELWARQTREEHAAWWVDRVALDAELNDRAVVVAEVGPTEGTRVATVQVRGGEALVVSGPPAAAPGPRPAGGHGPDPGSGAVALTGVLVVDVPDLDAAVDLARRSPAARTGCVEVRPAS
jgi:hypothetical protein